LGYNYTKATKQLLRRGAGHLYGHNQTWGEGQSANRRLNWFL